MPGYDPISDYSQVLYDERGNPYWTTRSGKRHFIPPLVAAQSSDPRLKSWAQQQGTTITPGPNGAQVTDESRPGGGLMHGAGRWNPQTGQWDQPLNKALIGGIVAGGALAAPAIAGALTGGAGAAGAGAAGSAGAAGAVGAGGAGVASSLGWLTPVLNYGVPLAGNIVGNVMQGRAQDRASADQMRMFDEAMRVAQEERDYNRRIADEQRTYDRTRYGEERDYARGQYNQYLSRLEPFRTGGMASLPRLEALLGSRRT